MMLGYEMSDDEMDLGQRAAELAETLAGMSLYTLRLATTPECPRSMTSELSLVRAALSVCLAHADALSNALDDLVEPAG